MSSFYHSSNQVKVGALETLSLDSLFLSLASVTQLTWQVLSEEPHAMFSSQINKAHLKHCECHQLPLQKASRSAW